jgi:hypothetical protein
MAEIDDIFASKGIPKEVIPIYSTSISPEPKKAANKKRKHVTPLAPQPDTRPAPEVVIDSSEPIVHAKRPKIGKAGKDSSVKPPVSVSKKANHDMESKFQDSRGSESRQSAPPATSHRNILSDP